MEIEREQMEVDVLFVGAGPGNLSAALHLMNLLNAHNQAVEKGLKQGDIFPIEEMMIVMIEKGSEVGAHGFSGAVLDPVAIKELMPDWLDQGCPVEGKVEDDAVMFLTASKAVKMPVTPPPLDNHGMYVVSLAKLCRWLGERCEEAGVQIFPGFPGVKVLFDEHRKVIGVRTGDKGVDPDGNPKDNFEPGIDLISKVTVFGEGPRGHLVRQLERELGIQKGRNPQTYEMGVKEVIELPEARVAPGQVIHTMGYPLGLQTVGGGFIYGMKDNRVAVGLVVDLHGTDPFIDAHRDLQRLKAHPWVAELLKGGKVVQYGGKALAAGGFLAMPKLAFDGGMIIGDAASMVNGMRLKGIHTAMKAGMLAAETIFEGLVKDDLSEAQVETYQTRVRRSYIHEELYKVRNFHSALDNGMATGMFKVGFQYLFGLMNKDKTVSEDHLRTREVSEVYSDESRIDALSGDIKFDGELFLDKLTDAYLSGTLHEEKQPSHLRLSDPDQCAVCWRLYRAPCTRFCPVEVYQMPEDVEEQVERRLAGKRIGPDTPRHGNLSKAGVPEPGDHDRGVKEGVPSVPGQQWPDQLLHINFTNCVHCKTCDIKCPYLNLTWTPPEGGGGPNYTMT